MEFGRYWMILRYKEMRIFLVFSNYSGAVSLANERSTAAVNDTVSHIQMALCMATY